MRRIGYRSSDELIETCSLARDGQAEILYGHDDRQEFFAEEAVEELVRCGVSVGLFLRPQTGAREQRLEARLVDITLIPLLCGSAELPLGNLLHLVLQGSCSNERSKVNVDISIH